MSTDTEEQNGIKMREATIRDLPILLEFEQGILQWERPMAPNIKPDPVSYYDIKELIERKDAVVVVAYDEKEENGENKPIASGYCKIIKNISYKLPEELAYLGFMYVEPKYRGQGINGLVVKHLINWAKERGYDEVQLDVYAENESALNAYKKMGFKPDLLTMRLH
jgi:ribosomal protein S18 acetylase RimI-like enzyme